MQDLGLFTEGVGLWSKMISTALPAARPHVFRSCCEEGATFVRKGADRATIADELIERAERHMLVEELGGLEGVELIIADALREAPYTNGHDTKPAMPSPGFWYEPRPFAEIPARQWLHAGHYIRRYVVMTVAPGGYGKSSLLTCNAIELALGKGLIGPSPGEPTRCWYWNAEEAEAEEIERRIAACCIAHEIEPDSLRGQLYLGRKIGADDWRFASSDRNGKLIINDALVKVVTQFIGDNGIGCTMLDPMVNFHRLMEIDTGSMEYLIKSVIEPIAIKTNSCIELSHHTRKPSAGFNGAITADDSRGAGAAVNAARSVRVINRMTEKEAELADIDDEERRLYLKIHRDKSNMAPAAKAKWARLIDVEIGNGDHVQAMVPWTYPTAFDAATVTVQDMEWMRGEVARRQYRWNSRSPEWAGLPLIKRLGLNENKSSDRKNVLAVLDRWLDNGVLAIEKRRDEKIRKVREFVVPGTWRDEEAQDAPLI